MDNNGTSSTTDQFKIRASLEEMNNRIKATQSAPVVPAPVTPALKR